MRNDKKKSIGAAGFEPANKGLNYLIIKRLFSATKRLLNTYHIIGCFLGVGILLITACAPIRDNIRSWNKVDTAYQAAALSITAVDGLQTHWMAKNDWTFNGHSHSEVNPLFFNSKPHQDAVDWLIPLAIAIHTGIAFILPPKAKMFDFEINPRRIWQGGFLITETSAVTNNSIHGAGMGN